jgi:hypothetical protein
MLLAQRNNVHQTELLCSIRNAVATGACSIELAGLNRPAGNTEHPEQGANILDVCRNPTFADPTFRPRREASFHLLAYLFSCGGATYNPPIDNPNS